MDVLRLIIIEDDDSHFVLMRRAILKELPTASVHHFQEPKSCLKRLNEIMPDVIITDYLMPGMNGIEFLEYLNSENLNIPIIMTTAHGDEYTAVQAMKFGARDYLVKSGDFFSLLPMVIKKVSREKALRQSLQQSEEQIRQLSRQLLEAQERERRMLSLELHDRVAQDLSLLKISCDTLFDDIPEASIEIKNRVSELSKILHRIIITVRDMSYELTPPGLKEFGFSQTVNSFCEDFSKRTGLTVNFSCTAVDQLPLDYDMRINLYRLIQEGLNNIKKHAQARTGFVTVVAAHPNLILRIEDDGIGFDVQQRAGQLSNEKRMGLRSMNERVGLLGGTMKIQSQPMKGTKIFIKIPIPEKKDNKPSITKIDPERRF